MKIQLSPFCITCPLRLISPCNFSSSRESSSAERPKGKVLTRGELDAVKAEAAEIEVREREAALSSQSSPRSANMSPRAPAEQPAAPAAEAAAEDAAAAEPRSRKMGGRMTQEEWDEIRRERAAAAQGNS